VLHNADRLLSNIYIYIYIQLSFSYLAKQNWNIPRECLEKIRIMSKMYHVRPQRYISMNISHQHHNIVTSSAKLPSCWNIYHILSPLACIPTRQQTMSRQVLSTGPLQTNSFALSSSLNWNESPTITAQLLEFQVNMRNSYCSMSHQIMCPWYVSFKMYQLLKTTEKREPYIIIHEQAEHLFPQVPLPFKLPRRRRRVVKSSRDRLLKVEGGWDVRWTVILITNIRTD